jgi:hypothetical protein
METNEKKIIKLTPEMHNHLVKVFNARCENNNYKGKKLLNAQTEFFCGAIALLDVINGNPKESSITPLIFFSILRGKRIEEIKH